MARALKRAGHGVMIAGRRVPLLMYADDVVLLASTSRELAAMMTVVGEFAHRNRFEYNGKKSGVMAFNASAATLHAVKGTKWELAGKKVKVVDAYTYLGAVTTPDERSWVPHVLDAISRAKRRSWHAAQDCHHHPATLTAQTPPGARPRDLVWTDRTVPRAEG